MEIERSDVVVFLLGGWYGKPRDSGKSPVHEEWDYCIERGRKALVFRESPKNGEIRKGKFTGALQRFVRQRRWRYQVEPRQAEFIEEIEKWEAGRRLIPFSDSLELVLEIVEALVDLGTREEDLNRLPPGCRERIEALQLRSPSRASRIAGLLADQQAKQPGFLLVLVDDPPDWLADAEAEVWEALSGFLGAHELGGSDTALQRAIDAGSHRTDIHRVQQAVSAAQRGDADEAERLMGLVPQDHPAVVAARGLLADSPSAVIAAVMADGLHESDNKDIALFGATALKWAHWKDGRAELAVDALQKANQNFPNRASLLLDQADMFLACVDQSGLEASGSREYLGQAAELALRARDLYREWDGPSHHGVATAMRALLLSDRPGRAAEIGSPQPEGEATSSEASDPEVQAQLAHAFMTLGRYRDISALQLDRVEQSEAAFIRAAQAHALGDPTALTRMRQALAEAGSESARKRALLGLARCGETDEEAMSGLSEAEVALFEGVATLSRGEPLPAASVLSPHRFASPIHAQFLADAQHQAGGSDAAIGTLRSAAEHFGSDSMLVWAAELLVELGRLDEAVSTAESALARNLPRAARHRLRLLLVDVAGTRANWQTLESYARALAQEFPEDAQVEWQVVHALSQQGEQRRAWAHIITNGLKPYNEETAQLAISVARGVQASEPDVRRLLEIAEMFPDSEAVTGPVIVAAFEASDSESGFSDDLLSQISGQQEEFTAHHPESEFLTRYEFESPEELLETMEALSRQRAENLEPLVTKARYGQVPYGILQRLAGMPYAQLLLTLQAGSLTSIPVEQERRDQEKRAAVQAIGSQVAVDTSVVAVGLLAGIDVRRISELFDSVLVADILLTDAQLAIASARMPIAGFAVYDHVHAQVSFAETSEQERAELLEKSESAREMLRGWQRVASGPLSPPTGIPDEALGPWEASIRVARDRQCALWSDDLAARTLAEAEEIPAFGTWALCEALADRPEGSWLPPLLELKMMLLRARISDVPIALSELAQVATDPADSAVTALLSRPLRWDTNFRETTAWYLQRVRALAAGAQRDLIPVLLHAATCGLGAAVQPEKLNNAASFLLAETTECTLDPEMVPILLAASRYAVRSIDPGGEPDPLQEAVLHMLRKLESQNEYALVAREVRAKFDEVSPVDLNTVVATIVGHR